MKEKEKIYFVILGLCLHLIMSQSVHAQGIRSTEQSIVGTVLLPPSVPEKDRFVSLSVFTIAPDGEIIAALGLYDDPQTTRAVDYVELYDGSGGLLAVGWLDRFGILRTAVDRALLQEKSAVLEGVFVLISEGTPA